MTKKRAKAAPKKKRRGSRVFLILMLAVLCIGGVELAASYFFAPAFFEKVTTPVIAGAKATVSFCRQIASDVSHLAGETVAQVERDIQAWQERRAEEERLRLEAQYADEALLASNKAIADPSVTEFREEDGKTILTGGVVEVVYFSQQDEAWADLIYGGSDTIGDFGCGPTVMAMVVSSMTAYERSPVQMSQWAVENYHWARRSGSNYSIVEGACRDFGLECTPITNWSADSLRTTLLSGDLVVALMGPGHFTRGGHFILLHGATLSGSVLVADPNSEERSLMEWDPQLILDELSASRGSGAPLWAISTPYP